MIEILKISFSDKFLCNSILQLNNISDELWTWKYVKPNHLSLYILIWRWWFNWWYIKNFFLIITLLWPKTSKITVLWDHIGYSLPLLEELISYWSLTTFMHTSPYLEHLTHISESHTRIWTKAYVYIYKIAWWSQV